jgi:proteasome lid subunit RPN8/RPN11
MNHAQNTPGYPVRLQIAFTNRDGVDRAYQLTELAGVGALVELPLATAQRYVEKDEADEYQGPVPPQFGRRVPFVKTESSCGCSGKKKERSPFGRLAGLEMVGEPLFAVAEGEEIRVACAGAECCEDNAQAGTPSGVRFDRYAVAEDGGYELRDSQSSLFPAKLTGRYAARGPECLPWVRVTRDPSRFKACLAKARAIGPMDNSKAVYRLVGEYMATQDQEVFLAILVDSQNNVRAISEIARGSRDRTAVSIPDTLRVVIVEGAMAFIVVHNHPSGVAHPSEADIDLTKALKEAAKKVNLDLLDHVIIGTGKYYSFAEHNKL